MNRTAGVVYGWAAVNPWSSVNNGMAVATRIKTRRGEGAKGSVACQMVVNVSPVTFTDEEGDYESQELRLHFRAATEQKVTEDARKALSGPERVLRALESLGGWSTKKQIQAWDGEHLPNTAEGEPANYLKVDTCYMALKRLAGQGKVRESVTDYGTVFAVLTCDKAVPENAEDLEPF